MRNRGCFSLLQSGVKMGFFCYVVVVSLKEQIGIVFYVWGEYIENGYLMFFKAFLELNKQQK